MRPKKTTARSRRTSGLRKPVLLRSNFDLFVVTSKEEFDSVARRLRWDAEYCKDCNGMTYDLHEKSGHVSHVVVQINDMEPQTACHEAVHVAETFFKNISEKKPSEEFRAYVTEAFFKHIMEQALSRTR